MNNNDPILVRWASKYVEGGNAFGFSLHSSKAAEHSVKYGVVHSPDGILDIFVGSPVFWAADSWLEEARSTGRKVVLYMSWELEEFPEQILNQIKRADAVICSSNFLYQMVRKELPDMPCELATLGVEPDMFSFKERENPMMHGGLFRFLYVGAANPRKGSDIIAHAWQDFSLMWNGAGMSQRCPVTPQLYMKVSTIQDIPDDEAIKCIQTNPAVILDYRKLKRKDLASLYHRAHAFVLPSFGECPGLTALEAASTGLPCLITPRHGLKDSFPPGTAVPLDWAWKMDNYMGLEGVRVPMAGAKALSLTFIDVMENYHKYLQVGVRAAEHMRRRFTWDECGRQVANALRSIRARLFA